MSSKPPSANIASTGTGDTDLEGGGRERGEGGGEVHVYAERGAEVNIHHVREGEERERLLSSESQPAKKKVKPNRPCSFNPLPTKAVSVTFNALPTIAVSDL